MIDIWYMIQYLRMKTKKNNTRGWGVKDDHGSEIWDSRPVFTKPVTLKDRFLLIFYPKRFLLFRYIQKYIQSHNKKEPIKILDIGCATGSSLIDMAYFFGDAVEIYGIDVVHIQVEMARENMRKYGMTIPVEWYNGVYFPYKANTFDIIYCSDVLGHVEDVPRWLKDVYRIVKPGGIFAVFSESALGKHAYIRNYLFKRGVNTDPHAEFHISLYSKNELVRLFQKTGFRIKKMYTTVWAKFFVHPDELYPVLSKQQRFFMLRNCNKWLYNLKKKLHPYSTALAELYSLIEMVTIGRFVESQGYIMLAQKPKKKNR